MQEERIKIFKSYKLWLKFVILSGLGVFIFFVPITIGGRDTISLDHMVGFFKNNASSVMPYYALIVIFLGAVLPFIRKTWNKDALHVTFSIAKVIGLIVAVLFILKIGPAWAYEDDMLPFLFNILVISVGIIVPIGAIFLTFLINYGLLEFIGVFAQKFMRPIFRTPGKSAIDAVASFVGSYSIGLLITNKLYSEGGYSKKEACVIATGFSTVSAPFMVIVARTLGLMDRWNFYFFSTLVITFIVTALTVRIYPLRGKSNLNNKEEKIKEDVIEKNIFTHAIYEGLKASSKVTNIKKDIWKNLLDGFGMLFVILPSILSIGFLGLILAKYTGIFDVLGYLFYPITYLFHVPDALLTAKAAALGVSEMFLPSLLMEHSFLFSKYVIAVVSVSSILFFSASIPCIISTSIPLKMRDIVIIWFERTFLSLILAVISGYLFL